MTNWLPWQQQNVYFQFMIFNILLISSWEKLPSFKVIAPFWSSEPFIGLEVENTPPPLVLIGLIDKHLTWKQHIHYVNLKISKGIGLLAKLRHFVPKSTLRTLYYAFIQPHVDYGLINWGCANKTALNPIRVSVNPIPHGEGRFCPPSNCLLYIYFRYGCSRTTKFCDFS